MKKFIKLLTLATLGVSLTGYSYYTETTTIEYTRALTEGIFDIYTQGYLQGLAKNGDTAECSVFIDSEGKGVWTIEGVSIDIANLQESSKSGEYISSYTFTVTDEDYTKIKEPLRYAIEGEDYPSLIMPEFSDFQSMSNGETQQINSLNSITLLNKTANEVRVKFEHISKF